MSEETSYMDSTVTSLEAVLRRSNDDPRPVALMVCGCSGIYEYGSIVDTHTVY